MNINEADIVGTFRLRDGKKYIFLADETVYKEDSDGRLTEVKMNKRNIRKMQNEIGTGETDVIR